jgi:hypothetical protein
MKKQKSLLSKIECLGGPLDGKWIATPEGAGGMPYTSGCGRIHMYLLDSYPAGQGFRDIWRWVSCTKCEDD